MDTPVNSKSESQLHASSRGDGESIHKMLDDSHKPPTFWQGVENVTSTFASGYKDEFKNHKLQLVEQLAIGIGVGLIASRLPKNVLHLAGVGIFGSQFDTLKNDGERIFDAASTIISGKDARGMSLKAAHDQLFHFGQTTADYTMTTIGGIAGPVGLNKTLKHFAKASELADLLARRNTVYEENRARLEFVRTRQQMDPDINYSWKINKPVKPIADEDLNSALEDFRETSMKKRIQVHSDLVSKFEFPDDTRLQALMKKAIDTAEKSNGPTATIENSTLAPAEKANLLSAREFGDEPHYRDLAERAHLARFGTGPDLSVEENADLYSHRRFASPYLRSLERKRLLAEENFGMKLTPEENADLVSAKRYPDEPRYRNLERQSLLAEAGIGRSLTKRESADLHSMIEFGYLEQYKKLAEKELLASYKLGEPLTQEEKAALWFKRLFLDNPKDKELMRRFEQHFDGLIGPEGFTAEEEAKLIRYGELKVSNKEVQLQYETASRQAPSYLRDPRAQELMHARSMANLKMGPPLSAEEDKELDQALASAYARGNSSATVAWLNRFALSAQNRVMEETFSDHVENSVSAWLAAGFTHKDEAKAETH